MTTLASLVEDADSHDPRAAIVILSPHLDDAVLSCGGFIQKTAQHHETIVMTLFAGSEPATISAHAQRLHASWRLGTHAVAARRSEDRQAVSLLGAHATHRRFLDCAYRVDEAGRFPYQSSAAIHAARLEDERPLLLRLTTSVQRLLLRIRPRLLLAPLGIGGHIDHRLTRAAAERATIPGRSHSCPLVYYEDVPYVLRARAPSSEAVTVDLQPQIIAVDLAAKVTAMRAYRSQTAALWPVGDMQASVATYGANVGGGQYAERFWVRTATAPETSAAQ